MGQFPQVRQPRPRRDYRGPRAKPGETVMLCPVERRMMVFAFVLGERLRCKGCTFEVAIEDCV